MLVRLFLLSTVLTTGPQAGVIDRIVEHLRERVHQDAARLRVGGQIKIIADPVPNFMLSQAEECEFVPPRRLTCSREGRRAFRQGTAH